MARAKNVKEKKSKDVPEDFHLESVAEFSAASSTSGGNAPVGGNKSPSQTVA